MALWYSSSRVGTTFLKMDHSESITANRDDSIEITKIMWTKRRKEEVALIKLMHITSWGYGNKLRRDRRKVLKDDCLQKQRT